MMAALTAGLDLLSLSKNVATARKCDERRGTDEVRTPLESPRVLRENARPKRAA